jgi:hypothetical protein
MLSGSSLCHFQYRRCVVFKVMPLVSHLTGQDSQQLAGHIDPDVCPQDDVGQTENPSSRVFPRPSVRQTRGVQRADSPLKQAQVVPAVTSARRCRKA